MKKVLLLLATCLFYASHTKPLELMAQEVQKPRKFLFFKLKNKKSEAKKEEKKVSEYEKLFGKPHISAKGMMTLHIVNDKIYFELPLNLLEKEMLIGSTISKISNNSHAIVGSKPFSPLHVMFTKNDTHVQLRQVSVSYLQEGQKEDKTYVNSHIPGILDNNKIVTYSPDSTAVVFEMTRFFVGDNKKMSPFDDVTLIGRVTRKEFYKPANSYPISVKAFGDNVSITSMLSYTYNLSLSNGALIEEDMPFSAEMTRSIILLKDKPYRPRLADYRIGIFNTYRRQLGSGANTTRPVRFANRWDIQPKDTVAYRRGELVEPVKPIVFYMDNTFPEAWKPYIKEGVEQWNELFEAIGFKNVVQVKDFPKNDPEFDPDNIKYSCIRYAPHSFQNAMGPSWVDPRSGEIINASVYVYHDVVKLIREWLFVQTAQANPAVRTVDTPQELVGDALRYVIAHEVGHCLGFMHNMIASYTIPVESLRSPEFTQKYGTTHSIMDYARFNYIAQPGDMERGVKLTPPRFGLYDRHLISWAYRPVFDAPTLEDEERITSAWITDSIAKAEYYRYGKQQFGEVLDPRSQSEDLGDDAMKASTYGINNLKYIARNLDSWISTGDDNYDFRRTAYNGLLTQLLMYIGHVSNNVGGYEWNELKSADKGSRFNPLSVEKQRRAMKFLINLYDDLDWLDNASVLNKMSVAGSPKALVQSYISRILFSLPMRVSVYEKMSPGSYKSTEAFDTVYDFVWQGVGASASLPKDRTALQTAYINSFLEIVKATKPHRSGVALHDGDSELDKFLSSLEGSKKHICAHQDCQESKSSPVLGFEWQPYNRFAVTRTTRADLYAYLMKVKDLLKQRIATTNGDTKTHYKVLLNIIESNF